MLKFKYRLVYIGRGAVLFLILISFHAKGQFINNNRMAIWPSIAVQKDFGDHWKIKLEHSTRMKFQPFMLDECYLQAGGEYSIRYNISVEANYRFSECYSPEKYFMPEHRVSFEADFKTNIKRWNFDLHPAVQAVFGRENQQKNLNPEWCLRPKVQIDYNVAKTSLNPFGSVEFFIGRRAKAPFELYKYRLTTGLVYKLTKKIKIESFIRQQGGFNSTDYSSYTIIGMDWAFRL
jgi:hypothetical protein